MDAGKCLTCQLYLWRALGYFASQEPLARDKSRSFEYINFCMHEKARLNSNPSQMSKTAPITIGRVILESLDKSRDWERREGDAAVPQGVTEHKGYGFGGKGKQEACSLSVCGHAAEQWRRAKTVRMVFCPSEHTNSRNWLHHFLTSRSCSLSKTLPFTSVTDTCPPVRQQKGQTDVREGKRTTEGSDGCARGKKDNSRVRRMYERKKKKAEL